MIKSSRIGRPNTEAKEREAPKKSMNMFSLAGVGVGGVIGAGFFLGSGLAVQQAGPAVAVAFLIGGLIMMQVLGSLVSVNVNRMEHGSFRVYAEEFLGRYSGYLLGWSVFLSGILGIGTEAIAMGVFARYWFPNLPLAVLSMSFMLIVVGLNALGGALFGRLETGMSALKSLALVLFIVLGGYALFMHGSFVKPAPVSSMRSFLPNGFSGLMQSMLIVIFAYSGIQAVAMASDEARNPKKDIPRASVLMSISIVFVYVVSMFVLVMITPWKTVYTDKSPFVQAFDALGLSWASTGLNFVVLIAAFSVMAATYYTSMHMLTSLAESNEAPQFFTHGTKKGFLRNSWLAVGIASIAVVGLSFLLPSKLYDYLVSASSYFTFLAWVMFLLTYLFWRKKKGPEETYHSALIWGRPGAYVTIAAILALLVLSLRVEEFRYGFYAALGLTVLITAGYFFVRKGKNLPPSSR
ncbi:MAG TPA: amino acid permease [Bacilli bacterium]|nr:amino acid permease [Bacilli bacterium]